MITKKWRAETACKGVPLFLCAKMEGVKKKQIILSGCGEN